ncbi:MAG: hypothetical protein AAFY41_17530, partial [Bacteroidota bacterium]
MNLNGSNSHLNGIPELNSQPHIYPHIPEVPDSETTRRRAFYEVINADKVDPYSILENLLEEKRAYYRELIIELKKYHDSRIDLYKPEILELEDKIQAEKIELDTHLAELPQAEEKTKLLHHELKVFKEELSDILVQIGEAKQNLLKSHIGEFKDNLSSHFENINSIASNKQGLSNDAFDNRKEVFKKRAERFDRILKSIEEQREKLKSKLPFAEGINRVNYSHLLYVGAGLSVVSGWFFATYVQSKQLGNTDFLSLTLENLILAGPSLFPGNAFYALAFNFGIYLLIAAAIVLSVSLASRLAKKLSPTRIRIRKVKNYPSYPLNHFS